MSTDLQRLFNEDPLNLTRTDIDSIIAYYRTARASFNLEGKVPKAKKEKVDAINLDDLLGGTPK
jgi:hypothetical protein